MQRGAAVRYGLRILAIIWILGVGAGLWRLWLYDSTPGQRAAISTRAPKMLAHALPLDPTRPTLILLAHPLCPCTQATLGNLATVMAQHPNKARVYMVFVHLKGEPMPTGAGSLWQNAGATPGIQTVLDEGGRIAQALGATTSGQVLLYKPNGQLIFEGGITAARGHSGDSYGADAIASLLNGEKPAHTHTPVFGCSLMGSTERVS